MCFFIAENIQADRSRVGLVTNCRDYHKELWSENTHGGWWTLQSEMKKDGLFDGGGVWQKIYVLYVPVLWHCNESARTNSLSAWSPDWKGFFHLMPPNLFDMFIDRDFFHWVKMMEVVNHICNRNVIMSSSKTYFGHRTLYQKVSKTFDMGAFYFSNYQKMVWFTKSSNRQQFCKRNVSTMY